MRSAHVVWASRWLVVAAVGVFVAIAACTSAAGDDLNGETIGGTSSGKPGKPNPRGGEPDDASTVTSDGSLSTPEGVTIGPAELTLGAGDCGNLVTGTITITNGGTKPAPYSVSIAKNDTFLLRDAQVDGSVSGTLDPGGYAYITVDAKASEPGTYSTDVVVKAGGLTQQITAKADIHGSFIVLNPPAIDFGELRKSTVSTPILVDITNPGDKLLTITGFSGLTGDFQITPPSVTLDPKGSTKLSIVMTSSADLAAKQIQIKPTTTDNLCVPAPSLSVKGVRVNQDVTIGPATFDFNKPFCGETPAVQAHFSVTNYATQAGRLAVYEAKLLSANSRFTIVSGATGSVPLANGTTPAKLDVVIAAKPAALPLDANISEDVEIKLTAPADVATTKIVKVTMGVYGAIIEVTPLLLENFAFNETKSFTVKNAGNSKTCVSYNDVSNNGFTIEGGDELLPTINNDLRVTFAAQNPGSYEYIIPIAKINCPNGTSAPICSAVPQPTVKATKPEPPDGG